MTETRFVSHKAHAPIPRTSLVQEGGWPSGERGGAGGWRDFGFKKILISSVEVPPSHQERNRAPDLQSNEERSKRSGQDLHENTFFENNKYFVKCEFGKCMYIKQKNYIYTYL